MTAAKVCFKCQCEKPLSGFYRQKGMADGYLNKCKDCTKKDVRDNRAANSDYYREYERGRANKPHRVAARLAYQQTEAFHASHRKACEKWDANNPERRRAQWAVSNAVRDGKLVKQPCFCCGSEDVEAHHPDYSAPLFVVWLCVEHHKQLHHEHELSHA